MRGRKRTFSSISNEQFEPETKNSINVLDRDTFTITAERCNLHLHPELSVQRMAYSKMTERLCVLRRMDLDGLLNSASSSNSNVTQNVLTHVEFYNASNLPLVFLEKSIPLFDALDSLVWIDSWAVLGGLSGKLYLFSPLTSRFQRVQLCATEIISMDQIDMSSFVVANNSGDLFILNKISDDGNIEENFFPKFLQNKIVTFSNDEQIISLACMKKRTPPMIAVGMVNQIKLISVQEKIVQRIIAIPHTKSNATMICSLLFMHDYLFAGDSHGQISIYNSENGTLLKTFKTHQAHILALATIGKNVFASGADYRIQVIKRIDKIHNKIDWQLVGQRLFHTNDVRAMCVLGKNWLASGGFEGFFISKKTLFCRPQLRPECSFSANRGILLSRHLTNANLWYKPPMGSHLFNDSDKQIIGYPQYKISPKLLIRIIGGSMGFIKQACISPNGNFICFAGNVKGSVSILQIADDVFDKFKTTDNFELLKNKEIVKQYWSNQENMEGNQIEGGKAVSAMHCTDENLYYSIGEYTIIQFNFSSKQQKIIANERNSGHIIKVSTNFSEKKLLALTTHSSVLLFGINGSHGCDTTALQFNQQIPYEVLFINDNSIVIISSNLKNHFICYDMVKNRQIYEKTTGDLGFVETEWIAYLTAIVPNQLWFSTNKGRIFMLQLDQSQVPESLKIYHSSNSAQLKINDVRIEPFLGVQQQENEERRSKHVILVGHIEENLSSQKPLRLKFFEKFVKNC